VFRVAVRPGHPADLADILDGTERRSARSTTRRQHLRPPGRSAAGRRRSRRGVRLHGSGRQEERGRSAEEHVGKVYTRAEIDAMDNGQIDNVFLTGGGYNCRHVWMEVSKFSELQDYVDTDQRPEVPETRARS
jgi:hypothetical protein